MFEYQSHFCWQMIWETITTIMARRIVERRARRALRLRRVPQLGAGFPSYDVKRVAIATRSPIATRTDKSSHSHDRKMRYERCILLAFKSSCVVRGRPRRQKHRFMILNDLAEALRVLD